MSKLLNLASLISLIKNKVSLRLFKYKPAKIFWILFLLISGYFLFSHTSKVALSESSGNPKKDSDFLAITVNAVSIIGTGLTVCTVIWVAGQEFAKSQIRVKEELAKELKSVNDAAITKNDEGLQRDLKTKGELATAINTLSSLLTESTNNNVLAVTRLENKMDRAISGNLQEILKIHSKFELGLFEIEAGLESQQKAYDRLQEKMLSADTLQQQQYVTLQKELQHLLRGFNRRLVNIEKVVEKKLDYSIREDPIDLDIEGLG